MVAKSFGVRETRFLLLPLVNCVTGHLTSLSPFTQMGVVILHLSWTIVGWDDLKCSMI